LALAVLALSGIGTAASAAAPYPPPATGEGKASPSRVKQGHCTRFSGDGFLAGTTIEIFDDQTRYGNTTADNKGGFAAEVCFAGDARVGDHVLSAVGANNATMPGDPATRRVTATVTVVGVEQSSGGSVQANSVASTTTTLVSPFSMSTLALLLLAPLTGLLLLIERRHRRRRRRRTA
jgi:hypothetical protein